MDYQMHGNALKVCNEQMAEYPVATYLHTGSYIQMPNVADRIIDPVLEDDNTRRINVLIIDDTFKKIIFSSKKDYSLLTEPLSDLTATAVFV
jgi:archaellum biogenesis ATPase FlaH